SHLAFEKRQQPRQLPTAVVRWHQQFQKTDVGVVRYELRHSRSDDPNVPFTSGTLSVLVSDVHVLVREQAVSHDGSMPVLFGIPVNLDTEARSFELCMIVAAVQAHVVLLAVDPLPPLLAHDGWILQRGRLIQRDRHLQNRPPAGPEHAVYLV